MRTELEIGINALYQQRLWRLEDSYWDDDGHHRGGGQRNNAISRATLNSTSGDNQKLLESGL